MLPNQRITGYDRKSIHLSTLSGDEEDGQFGQSQPRGTIGNSSHSQFTIYRSQLTIENCERSIASCQLSIIDLSIQIWSPPAFGQPRVVPLFLRGTWREASLFEKRDFVLKAQLLVSVHHSPFTIYNSPFRRSQLSMVINGEL